MLASAGADAAGVMHRGSYESYMENFDDSRVHETLSTAMDLIICFELTEVSNSGDWAGMAMKRVSEIACESFITAEGIADKFISGENDDDQKLQNNLLCPLE